VRALRAVAKARLWHVGDLEPDEIGFGLYLEPDEIGFGLYLEPDEIGRHAQWSQ
jgi:hypothetical protein